MFETERRLLAEETENSNELIAGFVAIMILDNQIHDFVAILNENEKSGLKLMFTQPDFRQKVVKWMRICLIERARVQAEQNNERNESDE